MRSKNLKLKLIAASLLSLSPLAMGFTSPNPALLKSAPFKASSEIVSQLKNWGLSNTRANSHIDAADAWKIQEGSKDIVVAVIDTGLDPSHKDLAANVWQDPSKKSQVYGWNFVENVANPNDDHGHGTHVAGIIGAVANPKSGVSGVAHKVSIMSVKYYSDSNPGSVNLRNTIKALQYAIDHGARIINYSGGGPEFSEEEYLAIKRAEAKGILVVAAAGNDAHDTDQAQNFYYPSAYRISNMISVAATDINNKLLSTSNWGKSKVDVAAPGENIYSTLPGGKYGYMSGTSQATAFVSGMAALILSENPKLTPQQVKQIIVGSVDKFPQLRDRVAAGGRVNAYKALRTVVALKNGEGLKDRTMASSTHSSHTSHPAYRPQFNPTGFVAASAH